MITRTFKLCLNAGTGSAPFINVSQYDEGETWLFELYSETGERYIPTTGAIVGVKSDGHGIVNTGTVDSEGRVVITETQQMTASAGRAIFELSIDGLTHGTANFIVAVERKPTDDAVMSDSDLSLIQEAIDSAEVIVEVIGDGDPSEVIGEHVDAWLDNHPEATTTVQDGAITAPKINSTLWDKLLVSEEASGAVASFDDGADDVPVSSLKVALEPIQTGSGDPSPSNIRPIIAANGKNMIGGALRSDSQTSYGVTVTPNGDGTFTANGTNTKGATSDFVIMTDALNLPVGDYIFNGGVYGTNGTGNTLYLTVRDANNQIRYVGNNGTADTAFSVAEGDYISSVFIRFAANGTANNFVFKPMIRLAEITDPSYQPYQGIMVERAGRNLLPPFVANVSWESGNATVVGTGDGAYKFNGTTTGYQQSVIQSDIHLKAGTYTFDVTVEASGTPVSIGLQLRNVSGGITYATAYWTSPSQTFTLAEDTAVRIRFLVQSALTFNNVIIKPQIELGNTATTYEPYQSTSYPYTLGQSVYGGTVDLATGVLTVTHGIYNVSVVDSLATKTGFIRVRSTNPTEAYASSTNEKNAITNNMVFNYTGIIGFNGNTSVPFSFFVADNYTYFVLPTSAATDVATANIWFTNNPTTVVYPLATPQTIQLTPTEVKTLLGYNNISSSGTVDVIYHADTKLYVDKMTAVDNNIIAPTEADFVATRNYTVNDLVIVNDTLYKVTANIASGSAITPNSNVTATTLSTLIKALS